jgi:colanic acid/amylovoran biosynthesis glycosyltransferase
LIEEGDCFLSISDYTRGNLIALGFPEKKILYHPVGIDLSKFTFRIRKLETGERSCIRIITVARLVKEQGLDLGIRAFYLVKKRFPDIDLEYVIAGGGPLLEGLKETADSIGLEDSVSFAGVCSHEKVSDLLNGSDIFLLPSIAEALPVSLIEAQASGLPVVAAKVGSVDQTLLEGKSGYLAKPQDVSDIAARLADLISDHEKWPIMSVAGRKFVEERYDIKKLNKKLESIYKRLMKE